MATQNVPILAFNRGIISPLGLARTDIPRAALSAEEQTNFVPRTLGSMMLRVGLEYKTPTRDNLFAKNISFIFATDDIATLELTNQAMRVLLDDEPITRAAVSTTIQSDDFSAATGWTDADEVGATSTISGGKLLLSGTNFNRAIRNQQVTVAGGDQGKEHALRIVVDRGPVYFRVGSTLGGDDYIGETALAQGTHSLAFTPTGNFFIQFYGITKAQVIVDECSVEAAGEMIVATAWETDDLRSIRSDQSADVVYVVCDGYRQKKIERRGKRSWSVVEYLPIDGPFRNINVSTISLAPSDLDGDIQITASRPFFKAGHVGALFKIDSQGQKREVDASGEDQWSEPIRVIGVDTTRRFTYTVAGTYNATITIQQSIGEIGAWTDYRTITGSGSSDDGLDNQIVYYRIGIKAGDYTDGTAELSISWSAGSITGIARVTAFNSETEVDASVIQAFGDTRPSLNWFEGEWSNYRGYPTSFQLYEGRSFQAGKGKVIGSISDAYEGFDSEQEGDAAPINRSIGSGPVDSILWLLGLNRLCFGTASAEWEVRSSTLDESLTADRFNMKRSSKQGSANVGAIDIDQKGFFVNADGTRLMQMEYQGDTYTHQSVDLMQICPELGYQGIIHIASQRKPDTRIHCVRTDGTVAMLVNEPAEEVLCWLEIETDGEIEDVYTFPTQGEDAVYYVVKREINGETVRYHERWASEQDCQGGLLNKQADSFITYQGASTDTMTGLDHLEGKTVVVWGDGKDLGSYVVSGGEITLSEAVEKAVIGLGYRARYKSTKLAYAASNGTALEAIKIINSIGVLLYKTHYQGLRYGMSFDDDYMDELPLTESFKVTPEHTVWDQYDEDLFEFDGTYDTDSRICLEANAPRPCTCIGLVMEIDTKR